MKFAAALCLIACAASAAELKPATLKAYQEYVAKLEASLPNQPIATPAAGQIAVDPAAPGNQPTLDVPNGLIHDWRASTLLPGVTAARFIAVLQDIGRYRAIYSPEVQEAKLLSKSGNEYRVFLKIRKSNIAVVVLNTEYLVRYRQLDATRWIVDSDSTKVSEVDFPGTVLENVHAPGTGMGYLWHIRSWWRLSETAAGLAVELRSVSLTRDLPFGTSAIIGPIVRSFPRESATDTITKTAAAAR
jgi:hypothetical protein